MHNNYSIMLSKKVIFKAWKLKQPELGCFKMISFFFFFHLTRSIKFNEKAFEFAMLFSSESKLPVTEQNVWEK